MSLSSSMQITWPWPQVDRLCHGLITLRQMEIWTQSCKTWIIYILLSTFQLVHMVLTVNKADVRKFITWIEWADWKLWFWLTSFTIDTRGHNSNRKYLWGIQKSEAFMNVVTWNKVSSYSSYVPSIFGSNVKRFWLQLNISTASLWVMCGNVWWPQIYLVAMVV